MERLRLFPVTGGWESWCKQVGVWGRTLTIRCVDRGTLVTFLLVEAGQVNYYQEGRIPSSSFKTFLGQT